MQDREEVGGVGISVEGGEGSLLDNLRNHKESSSSSTRHHLPSSARMEAEVEERRSRRRRRRRGEEGGKGKRGRADEGLGGGRSAGSR